MPKLTDTQCRNATCPPDKKRARLTDERGLYLEVSPAGSKRWFQKLYRDGKETCLALGSYPHGKPDQYMPCKVVCQPQEGWGIPHGLRARYRACRSFSL